MVDQSDVAPRRLHHLGTIVRDRSDQPDRDDSHGHFQQVPDPQEQHVVHDFLFTNRSCHVLESTVAQQSGIADLLFLKRIGNTTADLWHMRLYLGVAARGFEILRFQVPQGLLRAKPEPSQLVCRNPDLDQGYQDRSVPDCFGREPESQVATIQRNTTASFRIVSAGQLRAFCVLF